MTAPAGDAEHVSHGQGCHYLDDGYLVVPDLVGADELELLRRDTILLARGAYPCDALRPLPPGLSDQEILARLLCIHQPHQVSPVIRRFVTHRRIAGVLARLVGAHLAPTWWSGGVKCMQSMLFVKPPGLPGQAWHQDEWHIPTRDRSLTAAWVAIDDATRDSGCLSVLPGSHRAGHLYSTAPHGRPDEFDPTEEAHGFDPSGEIEVEVPAGSVVFFNGYLLHRSRRNRSERYRRALVCHYMTMSSFLPWEGAERAVQAGELAIARADYRGVVPVIGADPAWERGYLEPRNVWLRAHGRGGHDTGT